MNKPLQNIRMRSKRAYPIRKCVRLKDYDYSSDGYYFVTICAHRKEPNLSTHRDVLEKILLELPLRFSGLSIDYCVLMDTHLHIIFVLAGAKTTLGEIVRSFKALANKRICVKRLWQRGYYEHVIRSGKTLLKIREYIQNNPLVEKIEFKRFYDTIEDKETH